ncbi:MAG: hypothetical protein K2X93_22755 [Candidatus Obscuribacterales bacterium]|nr:hypothetical protein [Candidatus Obscuribacterales bacterium]
MIEQLFDLKPSCVHVHGTSMLESSRSRADDSSQPSSERGQIALVSIGNPLIKEDCDALLLIQLFRAQQVDSDLCLFSLDSSFAWLGKVLKRHNAVVILDVVQKTADPEAHFVTIPLNGPTLARSGFVIRATHGLSWIDEIKLYAIENELPNKLFFFGVSQLDKTDSADRIHLPMLAALNRLIEQCKRSSPEASHEEEASVCMKQR